MDTLDDHIEWTRAHSSVFAAETVEDLHRELLLLPGAFAREDLSGPVDVLRRHHARGDPAATLTAFLLLTDQSWFRRRAQVVASVVECEVLDDDCRDELAESLVHADDFIGDFPRSWIDEKYSLEIELPLDNEAVEPCTPDPPVREEAAALIRARRRIDPASRRWAAQHLVRRDASRARDIAAGAETLPPDHWAAVCAGVVAGAIAVDDEGRLADEDRQAAVDAGLACSRGAVRLKVLELLARRAPDEAQERAASDPDAQVRRWARRAAARPGRQGTLL